MHSDMLARIRTLLRKDGWLIAVLIGSVAICLLLQGTPTTSTATEETRLAQILSAMEGAGSVEVALHYTVEDGASVACAAVVVADGAGDVAVRLRLTRAVTTLLGIDGNRVEVFQRKGGSSHGQLDP